MKFTKKALLSLRSPSNAHLRLVNCAFSGFASLKIALFIQLLTKEGHIINTFGSPSLSIGRGIFLYSFWESFQTPYPVFVWWKYVSMPGVGC